MRRVLLTLFALLLAVLLASGWYAYARGFTKKWRNTVMAEMRRRGVEIYLRKLALDPRRGLVAQGVKVLDARDRRRVLAEIDEVILQVNYANLIRGKTFLDALDLRDARLALPIDPADSHSPRIEISRLNARLFLPPRQIYLAHADAEMFGIHIEASGRFINPQDFHRKPAGRASGQIELIARAIEELRALKFEAAPPVLSLTFSGDFSAPETILAEAALWGEGIRRGSYLLRSLYVAVAYRDEIVDLKQLALTDAAGALHLYGTFQQAARALELRLHSTADVQGLARAFRLFPELEEFVFYQAPALDLSVAGILGDTLTFQALGHLALRKFAWKAVIFEGLESDFSWDGQRWSVRDFLLTHRTGKISGDAMRVPGDFRAEVRSNLDPKPLAPLLGGEAAQRMALFEFRAAPQVTLALRGAEPTACTATGNIRLGATSYRGASCESLRAPVRFENRTLTLAPFHLQRAEGGASGGIAFDFQRDEVRLDKIKARVHPSEVARWIDQDLVKDVTPYRFKRAPNLLIDGVVHTKGGKSTRLTVDVDAPGGMDYTFLHRDLSFPEVSGKLAFTWDRMKIHGLSASLFGGRLSGDADISLLKNKPGHSVEMQLDNVDFASLTRLYFHYENSQGRLNARYDFTGRGDDARTMRGRGQVLVTDGNVFAIPFLGPFSGILNAIVPGMGYNTARKAGAAFTVEAGAIDSRDLVIEGAGFSMFGNGKLFFLDDRMAFNMRINAQGVPGVLLFPVSKLFEYTSDEKLSKPVWRARAVPKL